MFKLFSLITLMVLCTGALHADPLKVGQEAPKFKAGGTLINPPEFARALDDCKGDVILIYEWHMRDPTSGGLADIQKQFEKYNGKGLKVFTVHRLDFEKMPQVSAHCRDNGYTFPVAIGGFYDDKNDFFKYKDGKTFRTTVVGVDGKVAFYGKGVGWKAALTKALEKVLYANLGKHTVDDAVKKAAKLLNNREFGKAMDAAKGVLEGEPSDGAKADAELVIEIATNLHEARKERIEGWLEEKRYDLVMKCLESLKNEYRLHEIGKAADKQMKELKKDKDAKKELKGFSNLDKLIKKDGAGDPLTFVNSLKSFAKSAHGLKASEVASAMAKKIAFDLDDD